MVIKEVNKMENIIDLIVNNGIGVACIVYFMIRDYKFMQTLHP